MLTLCYGFCLVLGLVMLSDEQRRTAAGRIREALRLADIAVTKAALWMALDKSDLERGLSGQQKLDYWRLEMLPEDFHRHFYLLGLRDRGLPEYAKTALKISPAVEALKEKA